LVRFWQEKITTKYCISHYNKLFIISMSESYKNLFSITAEILAYFNNCFYVILHKRKILYDYNNWTIGNHNLLKAKPLIKRKLILPSHWFIKNRISGFIYPDGKTYHFLTSKSINSYKMMFFPFRWINPDRSGFQEIRGWKKKTS
jgi:hypothetical protein